MLYLDKSQLMTRNLQQSQWLSQHGSKQSWPVTNKIPTQQLITRLALDPSSEEGFALQEGVLKYQGHIWIGVDPGTQKTLIAALHDSAAGGHSGFHATYNWVRRLFAWKGLKIMVKEFVQQCQTCQKAKTERISPAGLLQPLPIPK